MNYITASNEIHEFIVENLLFGNENNFNHAASLFESEKINFSGFLELISFLEERFNIFFMDDELIPHNFDSLEKINKYLILKTSRPGN
jgi:acyl carrier protein